ncbi:MAG TPA: transposase, partial [Gemmatimonadales bacterium]|nr:transposase [Gemmatimonadales bacterium]
MYLVTWALANRADPLTGPDRDLVAETLMHFHGDRFELFVAVVMDDHVHAILRPGQGHPLEKIMHSWKSFTAHQLVKRGRTAPVWTQEYHDRIIREGPHLFEAIKYVRTNPERRWPGVREYKWTIAPA